MSDSRAGPCLVTHLWSNVGHWRWSVMMQVIAYSAILHCTQRGEAIFRHAPRLVPKLDRRWPGLKCTRTRAAGVIYTRAALRMIGSFHDTSKNLLTQIDIADISIVLQTRIQFVDLCGFIPKVNLFSIRLMCAVMQIYIVKLDNFYFAYIIREIKILYILSASKVEHY